MSWLFSRALVEEFSADTCSDGEPCAQLSVMPTPHKFSRNGKTIEHSDLSQFGLTCAVLTESRGEELLTWYQAGFHAKTSASQEAAPGSMEFEAPCGTTWRGSFAKFAPDSSTWKTAQCSLLEGSDEFSQIWPRWGLMADGECYQQKEVAPIIDASEFGLWPTPTASDTGARKKRYAQGGMPLSLAARTYPTPTANDAIKRGDLRHYPQYLVGAAQLLDSDASPLNPDWVEWLMGWPFRWTDLRPLEMDKFREWQQQHSPFYQLEQEAA
jgi:hypothetical protein